jgi:Uma2 family endonuclease
MSSAPEFAELLERLGRVPPERIRLRPLPGTATEEDVLAALEAPRKRICELMDGVLVEKAAGFTESVLTAYVIALLDAFIRPRNLGVVTGPDGTIRLWAGRVRIPDVAFFSWDRMPGRRRPPEPIPTLAPDLAIEVLSISNTPAEMRLKRQDYFSVGVRLVWEVDPRARSVTVYTAADGGVLLGEADTLDGGAVLPALPCPCATYSPSWTARVEASEGARMQSMPHGTASRVGHAPHAGLLEETPGSSAPETAHWVPGDVVQGLVERHEHRSEVADLVPPIAMAPPHDLDLIALAGRTQAGDGPAVVLAEQRIALGGASDDDTAALRLVEGLDSGEEVVGLLRHGLCPVN